MTVIPMAAAALLMFQTATAPKPAAPKAPATKSAAAAPAAKPAATDLGVTVTYKGKGAVDAAHKIIVFAFADSNITSGSRPIGPPRPRTEFSRSRLSGSRASG